MSVIKYSTTFNRAIISYADEDSLTTNNHSILEYCEESLRRDEEGRSAELSKNPRLLYMVWHTYKCKQVQLLKT